VPKIIKIGQCFTELFKKWHIFYGVEVNTVFE